MGKRFLRDLHCTPIDFLQADARFWRLLRSLLGKRVCFSVVSRHRLINCGASDSFFIVLGVTSGLSGSTGCPHSTQCLCELPVFLSLSIAIVAFPIAEGSPRAQRLFCRTVAVDELSFLSPLARSP